MLVGEKVILEEITPENLEQLRVWRNCVDLRQYFREWKDITPDKQLAWYKERGNNINSKHIYFQIMSLLQLSEIDTGIGQRYLIGACGLHYIDWRIRSAEFGIFLGKDHGTGKGKEALMLLLDFGFKEMGLHKISFWWSI